MDEPSKMDIAASLGITPLGLTIARKQLEGDDLLEKQQIKKTQQRKQKHQRVLTTTSVTKKFLDGKPQKNASWMALVEGVTLYGLCLVVPSLFGMIVSGEHRQMWNELQRKICEQSSWICWHVFGVFLPLEPNVPEPLTFAKDFASDTNLSDIYVIGLLIFTMALFRVLLVHLLVPNNLAPQQMEALIRCKSIHLLSSEYKQSLTPRPEAERSVITWDSFSRQFGTSSKDRLLPSLALFPTGTTADRPTEEGLGYETPTHPFEGKRTGSGANKSEDEQRMPIMSAFRHLSSNDLGLPIDTPVKNRHALLDSSQLGGFLQSCGPRESQDDNSEQQLMVEDSENDDRPCIPLTPQQGAFCIPKDLRLNTPTHSVLSFMERPSSPPPSFEAEEELEGFGWKRRGSTASLAAAAAAAVQEEDDHEEDHPAHRVDTAPDSPGQVQTPQRLFAAPRYATAVFRLLYCTISCAMAIFLFRDADFWPPYVGGHGRTTRCWDLSGSLALAKSLDSDFDHRNTVLRRFFLVQASYHMHSGAFHVFSVVLLHFLKKGEAESGDKNSSKKRGWISLSKSLIHPRALLQHSLSLIFLSVAYIFSSLRRLGAIGMFALDTSSWALHLLQTCLNAPTDSVLSKPRVIKGVWAVVVLPSFLYFRFWVWPMLGYSALVESEHWLAQLESTLVPGSALWFRRTFRLWMTLWMGFHAIHFKRLVFHPHIQRIMGSSSEQAEQTKPS